MTLKQYGYMALITFHTFGLLVAVVAWRAEGGLHPLWAGLNVSWIVIRTLQLLEARSQS